MKGDIMSISEKDVNLALETRFDGLGCFLITQELLTIEAQRDKLLDACEDLLESMQRQYPQHASICSLPEKDCPYKQSIDKAKAAIAAGKEG